MIAYETALAHLELLARERKPLSTSLLPVAEAVGLTCARTLASPLVVPLFDNSAMDGFAVRSEWFDGEGPWEFSIEGSIAAGDAPVVSQGLGAWEIMTGAPLPAGLDAVIRVEDSTIALGKVRFSRRPAARENIRLAGEDFLRGDPVIEEGQVVEPRHVLVLSTLGIAKIAVRRRPRIAVLATGAELVEPGALEGDLPPGKIFNSTAVYLTAQLTRWGADARYHGILADDPEVFLEKMRALLADEPDVILTTGAVSMGKHDFIAPALADLGAREVFHKVSIRPGKPLLAAHWVGRPTVFFGLPGNPVSTVIGCRFFVEPYLRSLLGRAPEKPWRLTLANPTQKPEGLTCFLKAKLDLSAGEARVVAGQASFLVSPLLDADGWVVLNSGKSTWAAGESVNVVPLEPIEEERIFG